MTSKRKNQHVVPRSGAWAIRGAGSVKDTATYKTQKDAIKAARMEVFAVSRVPGRLRREILALASASREALSKEWSKKVNLDDE